MPTITNLLGREILDSRGNPTVEAEISLSDGSWGRASVPSGASTGALEALELRDNDPKRYDVLGLRCAVNNINGVLQDSLLGRTNLDQSRLDQLLLDLDGTENKETLGANAILAVSLAAAKAISSSKKIPLYRYFSELYGYPKAVALPVPQMNILNGGSHADNTIDFQEFMIIPAVSETFSEALQVGAKIFHCLRRHLREKGLSTGVGDEGGYAPELASNEAAIQVLLGAIKESGFDGEHSISIGLDVASSELYRSERYHLSSENKAMKADEFVKFLTRLVDAYPIISIEDGMAESDWDGWKLLTDKIGNRIQLTGDDLFVTNPRLLRKGIEKGVANSVLIKPNQIGTLTETLQTISIAREAGYSITISHRSGETEDTTIADLAVAVGSCQIKTGSLSRSERIAKYNRLLRIEQELGAQARYARFDAFSPELRRYVQ